MPEQVQCPSCLQSLRVPDTLLGKKVKCPKCSKVFEAKGKQATEDEEGGSYIFEPEPVPEPKKKPVRRLSDDDENSEEEEGDEEEERRPKKKKRRHNAEALKKVSAPATGLQVTAALMLVWLLISVPFTFSSALQERFYTSVLHQPAPPLPPTPVKIGQGIGFLISFLIQIAIFSGASKMKQLESYRQSLVISIIAFLPCTCCFVGLPVGIWSLVVINSPEVRPFFKS